MPEATEPPLPDWADPADVPLWKRKHIDKLVRMKEHFGPVNQSCFGPSYDDADVNTQGLTKLEYASIQIFAALAANPANKERLSPELQSEAIALARALLSELNDRQK